jgi:hypothetical protein
VIDNGVNSNNLLAVENGVVNVLKATTFRCLQKWFLIENQLVLKPGVIFEQKIFWESHASKKRNS